MDEMRAGRGTGRVIFYIKMSTLDDDDMIYDVYYL